VIRVITTRRLRDLIEIEVTRRAIELTAQRDEAIARTGALSRGLDAKASADGDMQRPELDLDNARRGDAPLTEERATFHVAAHQAVAWPDVARASDGGAVWPASRTPRCWLSGCSRPAVARVRMFHCGYTALDTCTEHIVRWASMNYGHNPPPHWLYLDALPGHEHQVAALIEHWPVLAPLAEAPTEAQFIATTRGSAS
jgi:hypothetical protein